MFGHRITLFRLFGFAVRIDASWLILAGLITWGLARGYFPALAPGLPEATYWAMGLAGLLGLALSIVAHELAHAVVARRYDMPIHGITLFLFGGIAEMDEEPSSAKGEALMALAGPLMSLCVAALCWSAATLLLQGDPTGEGGAVPLVLAYLALINGLLAGFNMVPAFPLDGGRVLRAALWGWRGDYRWATRIAGRLGEGLGWLVLIFGLYTTAGGNLIGGLWWLMIGLFIRGAAIASVRQAGALAGKPLRPYVEGPPVSVPPEMPLPRLLAEIAGPFGLRSLPVTGADGRLLGQVDVAAVEALPEARRRGMVAAELMAPYPSDGLIEEGASAAAARRQMQRHRRRYLLVVSRDRLTGVLSLNRLLAANDDRLAKRG